MKEKKESKDDSYSEIHTPTPIGICDTHSRKNWMNHDAYIQEGSTAVCEHCGWGSKLPGYMRVVDGHIVDLRTWVRG